MPGRPNRGLKIGDKLERGEQPRYSVKETMMMLKDQNTMVVVMTGIHGYGVRVVMLTVYVRNVLKCFEIVLIYMRRFAP